MRFMILVKASPEDEARDLGTAETKEMFEAMAKYNEELVRAGILLAADGLHPSAKGSKIKYEGGKHVVTDGPFTEAKELLAGFWIIDVKSKEEAIEWAKRAPFDDGEEREIRQVFETEDFPSDVLSPELAARENAMRDELRRRA